MSLALAHKTDIAFSIPRSRLVHTAVVRFVILFSSISERIARLLGTYGEKKRKKKKRKKTKDSSFELNSDRNHVSWTGKM